MTKICSDCKIEMIEDFGIRVDEPISIDNKQKLYLIKNKNDYYGKRINNNEEGIKCRVCPNCGKIELFIDPLILK